MLPIRYAEALRALKDQALAGAAQIEDRKAMRAELADAQRRMSLYAGATKTIARVLMTSRDPSLTIETLTEERLEAEIGPEYLAQFGSNEG